MEKSRVEKQIYVHLIQRRRRRETKAWTPAMEKSRGEKQIYVHLIQRQRRRGTKVWTRTELPS